MALRPVILLWIGGPLGPIERLALTSFVVAGHETILYSYEAPAAVPAGVTLRDAAEVLPFDVARANRYANGSWALFSNLFRYEAQRLGLGIWVDTDVVCLRPIDFDGPFIAGWESDRFINGAVLYAAPDSGFIIDALDAFRSGRVPEWVPWHRAPGAVLRQALGRPVPAPALPHGTFGPKGVTALARRHGLDALAQPREVFYPVHPRDALGVFAPDSSLAASITDATRTVHLWNEKLRAVKGTTPPADSLLGALYARFGI